MTTFAAIGDLHIGAGESLLPPGERLADQEKALVAIADEIVAAGMAFVLITGDVFHKRNPTPPQMMVFAQFLRRLEDTPKLLVRGNHDVISVDLPTAAEAVAFHDIRCQVAAVPGHFPIRGVTVVALPWAPLSWLAAATDAPRDAVNQVAALHLQTIAAERIRTVRESYPGPIVLAVHFSLDAAGLPSGLSVAELREAVLSVEELAAAEPDVIVASHIHKTQDGVASNGVPWLYTGTPYPHNFGEENAGPHGWTELCTFGDRAIGIVRHEIPGRRFLTVDIDTAEKAPDQVIAPAVAEYEDLVRARITHTPNPDRDTAAYVRDYVRDIEAQGAAAVTVVLEERRETRARAAAEDLTDTLDSFEAWLEAELIPDEQRGQLRAEHATRSEAVA